MTRSQIPKAVYRYIKHHQQNWYDWFAYPYLVAKFILVDYFKN